MLGFFQIQTSLALAGTYLGFVAVLIVGYMLMVSQSLCPPGVSQFRWVSHSFLDGQHFLLVGLCLGWRYSRAVNPRLFFFSPDPCLRRRFDFVINAWISLVGHDDPLL